jgi:hypothetical protein
MVVGGIRPELIPGRVKQPVDIVGGFRINHPAANLFCPFKGMDGRLLEEPLRTGLPVSGGRFDPNGAQEGFPPLLDPFG